jgi:hypothetical protein
MDANNEKHAQDIYVLQFRLNIRRLGSNARTTWGKM